MALALTNTGAGQIAKSAQPNKITQRSVPAFLNKLFTMVNDSSTDSLIRWSDDGDSFIVPSADRFGRELLPRFFKHCNFGSFVRQLNMYGFHKVPHIQSGALKNDDGAGAEVLEFSNPNFARAQPDLLCLIRRQKAKTEPSSESSALDLPVLLTDLAAIQKHQKAISADLKDLQVSNHALWQEALSSREKHQKQQETINKILRFLATVFGGQVVNDVGESPAASVVEEDGQGGLGRSSSQSATPQPGTGAGGKGKARSVAVVPKVRSRLLLEDVKGRQSHSPDQSSRFAQESDNESESNGPEIEEIPLLADDDADLPTISSATQYGTRGAMSRSNSQVNPIFDNFNRSQSPSKRASTPSQAQNDSSRFTTLPTATSTPLPAEAATAQAGFQLQPDMVNSLLHPNNSNSLSAFLAMQNSNDTPGVGSFPNLTGGGSLAPAQPTTAAPTSISMPDPMTAAFMGMGAAGPAVDYSRAILPSSLPPLPQGTSAATAAATPMSSALASLLPSQPVSSIGPTENEMALHHQALRSVARDKNDIEDRTTALENAIAKLMQSLPGGARESLQAGGTDLSALLSGGLPTSPGQLAPTGLTPGSSGGEGMGMQWPVQDGTSSEVDLDKFLAQYVNNSANSPGPQAAEPVDYSYLFDSPAQPNTNGAADSPGGDDSFFDEDDELEEPVWESQSPAPTAAETPTRGKKRKSDASELGQAVKTEEGDGSSPEGTRKSARRRKR